MTGPLLLVDDRLFAGMRYSAVNDWSVIILFDVKLFDAAFLCFFVPGLTQGITVSSF